MHMNLVLPTIRHQPVHAAPQRHSGCTLGRLAPPPWRVAVAHGRHNRHAGALVRWAERTRRLQSRSGLTTGRPAVLTNSVRRRGLRGRVTWFARRRLLQSSTAAQLSTRSLPLVAWTVFVLWLGFQGREGGKHNTEVPRYFSSKSNPRFTRHNGLYASSSFMRTGRFIVRELDM